MNHGGSRDRLIYKNLNEYDKIKRSVIMMKKKTALILGAAAGVCLYLLGYGHGHRRGKTMYVSPPRKRRSVSDGDF